MKTYKIKCQSSSVEQVVILSANSPAEALEEAKKYFPERMHSYLSLSSDDCEFRELLRKNRYPERALEKLSDEECQGECEAIGII
ncbi:hypothetical protein ABOUO_81 [Brevibacillus phage Abouo]|uniref:Uncharacterized protein n=1 Tax=Brevibacillus phage Abouo TaxID=1296661 RepID=S5MCC7_9CAUD|nr:hypothetical protein AVV45_gp81 [Brevibacillus phage Abouo]AGR47509.1 hypothetical protein ABOUO_81 [Brevibacillus phage Abouo]